MATEAPFPEKEYLDRYERAYALMERDGLDALVISEKNNYWYFSGLISYQLDHIQRPQICFLPQISLAGTAVRIAHRLKVNHTFHLYSVFQTFKVR